MVLLFTDIEGSSGLAERLGDRRFVEVLRAHNGIIRACSSAHGGIEVKSQGDGFMLAFDSEQEALACAVAAQHALAAFNDACPDACVKVRMGLHSGHMIRDADDFLGREVIVAARIAGLARGGEILVSMAMRERVIEGAASFSGGREVALKGLSGTQTVFAASWRGANRFRRSPRPQVAPVAA